jgi:hypothetical protein
MTHKEQRENLFKHKDVLCIYNKRVISVDGIDEKVTLQSPFPSFGFNKDQPKFKTYQDYYET